MSGGELRIGRRVWLGCLAFAGVLSAHLISYVIAAPHSHARRALLASTGHGSQKLMLALAVAALVAALVAFAARWLAVPARTPASRLWGPTVASLVTLQAAGFIALEATERLQAHGTLSGLMSEPAVLIGLLVQVLVAFVGSLLVVVVAGTVEAIVGRVPEAARSSITYSVPAFHAPVPLPVIARGWTLRGPPSPVSF